jgi:predicted ATPase
MTSNRLRWAFGMVVGFLTIIAAPLAAQALESAPRLKLLMTSREPLRLRTEQVVPIQPLALPDPGHLPDLETLAQVPSVALFLERVRAVNPDFALTADNAATIVEICRRLDALPLALELAAARLALLTPEGLLERMKHRLPLLTRGARDLPERQQTLRNTIAWSYDLLSEPEKHLFRHLAVFVGGFSLDAVESIYTDEKDGENDVVELVTQLLDKSLVQAQQGVSGEPRFSMLETIHEYAQEQLEASGEVASAQQRHADYFLRLAEQAEPHMFSPERDVWMERLDHEDANLRAALAWSKAESTAVQTGLRLASALSFLYWFMRGSVGEGRRWLEGMLERTDGTDRSAARGKALRAAGWLAWKATIKRPRCSPRRACPFCAR